MTDTGITIWFDMDGTIADLYGVENWLPLLRAENPLPYVKAEPLCDLMETSYLCRVLQARGYKIGVVSWLAKNATPEYKKATRDAKKAWLLKRFPIVFDEMHFIQYGTSKTVFRKSPLDILIDDDDKIREKWEAKDGITLNPKEEDINDFLHSLIA